MATDDLQEIIEALREIEKTNDNSTDNIIKLTKVFIGVNLGDNIDITSITKKVNEFNGDENNVISYDLPAIKTSMEIYKNSIKADNLNKFLANIIMIKDSIEGQIIKRKEQIVNEKIDGVTGVVKKVNEVKTEVKTEVAAEQEAKRKAEQEAAEVVETKEE